MHRHFLFLAATLISFYSLARVEMTLPNSLSSKAIYHIKVKQLHEFSCGFNVAFNGCNVENMFGIAHYMSDFHHFRKACYDFAAAHKLKRKGSLGQSEMRLLADYLGMGKMVYPYFDRSNQLKFAFYQQVTVTFPMGTPKAEVELLKKRALERQYNEYVLDLQEEVNKAHSYPYVLHFACAIDVDRSNEGHFILVTLVKNQSGRALYVCDNINKRITESSDTCRCLKYLADLFSVSPRNSFKGPSFTEGWSSLRNVEWKIASEVSATP